MRDKGKVYMMVGCILSPPPPPHTHTHTHTHYALIHTHSHTITKTQTHTHTHSLTSEIHIGHGKVTVILQPYCSGVQR